MICKVLVDSCSLEYAKLEAICPAIVSAEFLKRARERFLKTADRTVRIGSIASIAFAPYAPVFSPQEKAQNANGEGHTLTVDTSLNLNSMPKTFEVGDGTKVIFGNTEREQVQSQEVSVFGVMAGFNERGNLVLSATSGETREIVLPYEPGFTYGEAKLSPDGTKIAVWRQHRVGPPPVRYNVYLVVSATGEAVSFLPGFLENLGQFPTLFSFTWSPDGKKLAFAAGQHGGGKTAIVDTDTGQVLFELQGSEFGEFSPDGQWFAKIGIGRRNLEVVNVSGPKLIIPNNGGPFSWSRDSSFLAFHNCQRWAEQPLGPYCELAEPAIYNLAGQRIERFNTLSLPSWRPEISPDGSKILFMAPYGGPRIPQSFVLWNRQTGELPAVPISLNQIDQFSWRYGFHTDKDLLFYGRGSDARIRVIWIDTQRWVVVDQVIETGRGEAASIREITQDFIIYDVFRIGGERRDLYVAPITKNNTPIRGRKIAESLAISSLGSSEVFGFVQEGDIFTVGEKTFIFQEGKRRLIENEEAAGYFQGNRSTLAEGLVPFIPEGEPLQFSPGDVVGHKDAGLWYLRNGKRYKIQNWDWFKNRQRFNIGDNPEFRRGEWTIPKELIEMIPEGEVLSPVPGETGIRDWDGAMKEFQPFGGRMIIFIGGYNGSTQSQQETFRRIKEKLMERGWRENQFLEATYSIDIDAQRRLVLPKAYLAKDTKVYPPQSVSKLRLQLQRYKEMFPLTSFSIVGHSLGGFEGFEAALAHSDAVQAVITFDSPLKGVDRAFLVELPGLLDQVVEMVGDEVMEYMNILGDDPARRQEQEAKAWQLYTRKVRVFTFSNDDDWFVRNGVAVLENSASEFEGHPVRLVWQLGHFSPRGIEDLVSGHGQILQEESFLEELARILPAA